MLKLDGNTDQSLPLKIRNVALLFGVAVLTTGAQFMPLPMPVPQLPLDLERTDRVEWGTLTAIEKTEETNKPLWASEIEEIYQTYRVLSASA